MNRELLHKLRAWKQSPNRKPMILRGARQVGKTWLMKELGRTEYEDIIYINFESDTLMRDLFELNFDVDRIVKGIEIASNQKLNAETVLLILDEIQACPQAITSLKYFYENAPKYHIICAGSLLGVAIHQNTSFPVGKVEFTDMYPLNFQEFLEALNEQSLLGLLLEKDWEMIHTFSSRYKELLRQYYYVGGMPEVVQAFIETQNYDKVRELQKQILTAYELDFSKHAPNTEIARIRMVWNSIPGQLSRENKKFIYGQIRKGARAKEFEIAIQWLKDSGLIHKVQRVSKAAMPLKAYEDIGAFKLFVVDVGLLGAQTGIDKKTLLEGNLIFQEFKGALTEQYVLQQFKTLEIDDIFYWSATSGRAEIDFIIQSKGDITAVEVKAEENLQSKSLKSFSEKYSVNKVIRTSMSSYREESWMTNLPLYALIAF